MDNLLEYSNSGLSQSLNGISTISDGDGASISNGNAIFLDTNSNTITVNNILTIPLTSLIYLYGGIYLVNNNFTITEAIMYSMYTKNNSHDITLTNMTYDSPTNTTSFTDNFSLIGSTINIGNSLQATAFNFKVVL